VANSILAQANVRFNLVSNQTATLAQTNTWLGGNTDLRTSPSCGVATAEERGMMIGATAQFGLTSRIKAFFLQSFSGSGALAYSVPNFCGTGPAFVLRGMAVIPNVAGRGDLAHESVHILTNMEGHRPAPNLMSTDPLGVVLTNTQRNRIYNGA
jgi:hypothetical protein